MRVSHVNDSPVPTETPVTFTTCSKTKPLSASFGKTLLQTSAASRRRGGGAAVSPARVDSFLTSGPLDTRSQKPHRNGQGHPRQFGFSQVTTEDGADEADHERHRLRNNLRRVWPLHKHPTSKAIPAALSQALTTGPASLKSSLSSLRYSGGSALLRSGQEQQPSSEGSTAFPFSIPPSVNFSSGLPDESMMPLRVRRPALTVLML